MRPICWLLGQVNSLLGLVGLLGQEHGLDVGQNTSLSNGDSGEKFVQFLVITDGQLQMPGDDPGLLVVTGSISCQLKNLSCEVLHDSSQVDGGSSSDPLSIVALSQVTVDPSHWELQTGPGRPSLALALGFSSLSASRHVSVLAVVRQILNELFGGRRALLYAGTGLWTPFLHPGTWEMLNALENRAFLPKVKAIWHAKSKVKDVFGRLIHIHEASL